MSVSLPPSSSSSPLFTLRNFRVSTPLISPNSLFKIHRSFPQIRASTGNTSSVNSGLSSELDVVSLLSEIVPDTVIFDDFQRFPPTAATVSSSLLLGICSLPDTIFRSAVETALADSVCYTEENSDARLSCFVSKGLFVFVRGKASNI
ncbi:hypothetical protein GIB67_038052 [Kingdonia uniflora]|uniref:Uncharacterized protein n=1 Tax=Kingdonia uniflora TaxID=39325 RepID=A0A7J7MC37_9MAGN|nr:hypothetical protein GIB67_038052 [Kingdonia uniflora]